MDLLYIWHGYRYWSKLLFDTIPTPAYDLEVKVMDSEAGLGDSDARPTGDQEVVGST